MLHNLSFGNWVKAPEENSREIESDKAMFDMTPARVL